MNQQYDAVGKPERATQDRVIRLFQQDLGYTYLGDWSDRDNSNVEPKLLRAWLDKQGVEPAKAQRAVDLVQQLGQKTGLSVYEHNQRMYELLRYGVAVKVEAGENNDLVPIIDWDNPAANDFALAEEVTLHGVSHTRRPDLVLYVNGLALGVIELKRSTVGVGEGIRQTLSNQEPDFNPWFYSTVQFTFAGNDTEGLRYGTVGTPEKYWLTWKEPDEAGDDERSKLDKYLRRMCQKDRLIELCRDFVLFDGGVKKVPRVHQYSGVKAAQRRILNPPADDPKGGVIWHTQGSGKSLVMALLARWLLEHNPAARVAVITDREELDAQIVRVFRDAGLLPESVDEHEVRATSGRDLLAKLGQPSPRLLCSLVHKFGKKGPDFAKWLQEMQSLPSPTVGELYVFVDECHRTQSGRLHKAMKAVMPKATFIGFTGTPLLKADAATSQQVFGGYIHTYTFKEGVEDGVVLDLLYEARDIDQRLSDESKIDEWFEAKTRGLNDWQKQELQNKWGTMQRVLSSRSRMDKVVQDIVFDFNVKPRLSVGRGNAILVASSILEACRYFGLFQLTELKGRCAVITSYDPQVSDVTTEETGANTATEKQVIFNTYQRLLDGIAARPGLSQTETFEAEAKEAFIKRPAEMRLLVVVDKLLTGFDAPPCTYLYIDKSMQNHGLFQAICRTNRLDGEDKPFGFIVDYKNLFAKVKDAIEVYTEQLENDQGVVDSAPTMADRLERMRERLEEVIDMTARLLEPVPPPNGELQHIRYFCGDTEKPNDLVEHAPLREQLYKAVASVVRAYAGISDDLPEAGFTEEQIEQVKRKIKHFLMVRDLVKQASGEVIDLKGYEADMRHLIDTYIDADAPRKISDFDDLSLLELIEKSGIANAIDQQLGQVKGNEDAVAETIENNVRRKITRESLTDPAFFSRMSKLLDALIEARRRKAIAYADYLKKMAELAKQVQAGFADDTPEQLRRSPGLRSIYHFLQEEAITDTAGALDLTTAIDTTIRETRAPDFRGNPVKERRLKQAIYPLLNCDEQAVERLFLMIKAQEREY